MAYSVDGSGYKPEGHAETTRILSKRNLAEYVIKKAGFLPLF